MKRLVLAVVGMESIIDCNMTLQWMHCEFCFIWGVAMFSASSLSSNRLGTPQKFRNTLELLSRLDSGRLDLSTVLNQNCCSSELILRLIDTLNCLHVLSRPRGNNRKKGSGPWLLSPIPTSLGMPLGCDLTVHHYHAEPPSLLPTVRWRVLYGSRLT